MYKTLKRKKDKKGLFSISVNIDIDSDNNYLAYPIGNGFVIDEFKSGKFDEISNDDLGELLCYLFDKSLNREKYNEIKNIGSKNDRVYAMETAEYKKDKCRTMKKITIKIADSFPDCVVIIDNVCTGRHLWGGGKYVHYLPIDTKEKDLISFIREICNYDGHMPGASDEEFYKYRSETKR